MREFPYGSDYRSDKTKPIEKNPSSGGTARRAAGRMSEDDRDYMSRLAARVDSNKPGETSQTRYTTGGASVRRKPSHTRKGTATRSSYVPQSKARKAAPKKGGGLRIAAFVVLLLFLSGAGIYFVVSQGLKDGGVALPKEIGTLPEFKGDEVNFLVCGIDYDNSDHNGYSSDDKIGRTDLLLYVHYNVKEGKISILQMPRDTYVGEDLATGGNYKINSIYYFADKDARMKAVANVFNQQFGLPVDFYITLDMEALIAIIDHIGYITMYVPMEIMDPENPGSRVAEGVQNLTSEQLQFILRNRTTPGYNMQNDIARLRTQQFFYSALFREFKQLSVWDLAMWFKIIIPYMKTDTSISNLIGIGLKALNLDGAGITFVRPACGPVSYKDKSLLTLIREDFAEVVNTYFHPTQQPEIFVLPLDETMGLVEREVKTMADIQGQEPT